MGPAHNRAHGPRTPGSRSQPGHERFRRQSAVRATRSSTPEVQAWAREMTARRRTSSQRSERADGRDRRPIRRRHRDTPAARSPGVRRVGGERDRHRQQRAGAAGGDRRPLLHGRTVAVGARGDKSRGRTLCGDRGVGAWRAPAVQGSRGRRGVADPWGSEARALPGACGADKRHESRASRRRFASRERRRHAPERRVVMQGREGACWSDGIGMTLA